LCRLSLLLREASTQRTVGLHDADIKLNANRGFIDSLQCSNQLANPAVAGKAFTKELPLSVMKSAFVISAPRELAHVADLDGVLALRDFDSASTVAQRQHDQARDFTREDAAFEQCVGLLVDEPWHVVPGVGFDPGEERWLSPLRILGRPCWT
jgi:hypothetical protein